MSSCSREQTRDYCDSTHKSRGGHLRSGLESGQGSKESEVTLT